MDIITTARRFELTPEIREYARKRLEKLQRYADRIDEVRVVLAAEKYRQIAEVTFNIRGSEILSREESDDMLISIDRVVDRVERQLKRLRARRREDRRGGRKGAEGEESRPAGPVEEGEDESEVEETFAPVVIHEEGFHPEPLTVEQAIELLRERESDVLLFPSARSGRMMLVRLRPDGNYGLIESQ
jgi:putative sigma-54 modulation protein